MSFGSEPIPWKLGFLRSDAIKRGFLLRVKQPLTWRPARESDWPPEKVLDADFDWARRTGTGYVAETDEETLYLFHRDWFGWPDPPEWALASLPRSDDRWHLWGSFDVLPPNWNVPESSNASN